MRRFSPHFRIFFQSAVQLFFHEKSGPYFENWSHFGFFRTLGHFLKTYEYPDRKRGPGRTWASEKTNLKKKFGQNGKNSKIRSIFVSFQKRRIISFRYR